MFKLHTYPEHYNDLIPGEFLIAQQREIPYSKRRGEDGMCIQVTRVETGTHLQASYYIGVDWIDEHNAVYIAPKLNKESRQTDYLKMLFSCLKHPEVLEHTEELFEIKFDQPFIEIEQKQDLITPLLVIQFLQVVHSIVRKGLKKSYYPVEEHLNGRIKGKVLVGPTIKQNIVKNRPLRTLCRYDEFGWNGLENRLLKKALLFAQRYLAGLSGLTVDVSAIMNYCLPAFQNVSEKIALSEVRFTKTNAFYKEYGLGIRLAKLILRRFGYNIQTVKQNPKIKLPPFWIDMSKLFELYVLGLLKDRYPLGNQIKFQFQGHYGQADYLLNTGSDKMIIDAKYKPYYQGNFKDQYPSKRDSIAKDIRQLSGYARDKKVCSELGYSEEDTLMIDCLIIFPAYELGKEEGIPKDLKHTPIEQFCNFYKLSVRLPEI